MTYGETFILLDPEDPSPVDIEFSTSVAPHEFAHVWFGDLVTLDWWSRMWLNEGFATLMSDYYAADDANPEMGQKGRFTIEEMHGAMEQDSKYGAPTLDLPFDNPQLEDVSWELETYEYHCYLTLILLLTHRLPMALPMTKLPQCSA